MAGVPWNGACNYRYPDRTLCGVRTRRGATRCATHGGTEYDERSQARRDYTAHRNRVQASKALRAYQAKTTRNIEYDRSEQAQSLMARVLRGDLTND